MTTVFTPITIGADLLLSSFAARNQAITARAVAQTPSPTAAGGPQDVVDVLPPWDPRADSPNTEDLARRALASGEFLDPRDFNGFSDVDAPEDIQKLFALHEAFRALSDVATQAAERDASPTERRSLDRRFQEGLTQVLDFIRDDPLDDAVLVAGEARDQARSSVPIARAPDRFTTEVLATGDFEAAVPAFETATPFTIEARDPSGNVTAVTIDLSLMDPGETKSLGAVADFINTQLADADLNTRFQARRVNDVEEEIGEFAFEIRSVGLEALSFRTPPAQSGPALFVAGTSGVSGEDTVQAGQLTRLTDLSAPGGPTVGSSIRLEAQAQLTAGASDDDDDGGANFVVKQAVASGDGVFVLAESTGTVNGVGPQGERDVFLVKYDTAGRQIFARALGAAESADGLALAVGANGDVAVGGAVTGVLGATVDVGGTDAFVASFDADGEQRFLRRFGGVGDDAIQALAVGDDGAVFVGGRTSGALVEGAFAGQTDGFIRGLNADGSTRFTQQFGGAEADAVSALAIDGGALVTASVENGEGVLRKLDLATGAEDPGFAVNLGDLDSGQITALAVDEANGAIFVAGSARGGFGLPTNGNAGARDAFVARLASADGTVEFARSLGGTAEDVAADFVVDGGSVYLTGTTRNDLSTGDALESGRQSFVAELDAATGALGFTTQIQGRQNESAAAGLALIPGASNTLSAFGLPTGPLSFADSSAVADRTTAKVGDFFDIRVNGVKRRITLEEGETLRGLAFKIDLALGTGGSANQTRIPGGNGLRIRPADGGELELIAGAEGRDLLSALGIEPGKINRADPDAPDDAPPVFELELPRSVSLADRDGASAALERVNDAMSALRRAYRELTRDPALDEALAREAELNGPVPEFLTARIANYEAALQRLGGAV